MALVWNVNGDGLDVTNSGGVTIGVDASTESVTVTHGGESASFDIKNAALGMELSGDDLFRKNGSTSVDQVVYTVPFAQNPSIQIRSLSLDGGVNNWYLMIGQGDIRTGVTYIVNSLEGRQIDLKKNKSNLVITAH